MPQAPGQPAVPEAGSHKPVAAAAAAAAVATAAVAASGIRSAPCHNQWPLASAAAAPAASTSELSPADHLQPAAVAAGTAAIAATGGRLAPASPSEAAAAAGIAGAAGQSPAVDGALPAATPDQVAGLLPAAHIASPPQRSPAVTPAQQPARSGPAAAAAAAAAGDGGSAAAGPAGAADVRHRLAAHAHNIMQRRVADALVALGEADDERPSWRRALRKVQLAGKGSPTLEVRPACWASVRLTKAPCAVYCPRAAAHHVLHLPGHPTCRPSSAGGSSCRSRRIAIQLCPAEWTYIDLVF